MVPTTGGGMGDADSLTHLQRAILMQMERHPSVYWLPSYGQQQEVEMLVKKGLLAFAPSLQRVPTPVTLTEEGKAVARRCRVEPETDGGTGA